MTPEHRAALSKIAEELDLYDLDQARFVFMEEKFKRLREGNYKPTFDPTTGTYQRDREIADGYREIQS